MGEFDLIKRYFNRQLPKFGVELSIGDDCAIVAHQADTRIAISTDTLVAGSHFLANISAADLAYKSIAVNLSDLAAMGAKPAWISLALTLDKVDHDWLAEFSHSLFAILDRYQTTLIGGDTTRGPLALTITAQGLLPKLDALLRQNAKEGDWIFVSGTIGDSAAGLALLLDGRKILEDDDRYLVQRHLCPTPRVELGLALRSFSRCAIDISDGLLADLNHILESSQVGAEIYLEHLPLSTPLLNRNNREQAEQFALTGGEDYELCFTVADDKRAEMEQVLHSQGMKVTCIGKIVAVKNGMQLFKYGQPVAFPTQIGFDHFNE